jgi:non-specific serine/threonine protein kinase/serine/threonine-protein kinase
MSGGGPAKVGEGFEDTLPLQRPMPEAPPLEQARIGPYQLVERLGEGGMGEVWLAEQQHPLRRKVALKIIKAGMDTREVVARFESERQALAMMDHPAIARVLDAGSTPEGRPYFVMEYVPGLSITEHCDTKQLSTTERLELLAEVCDGVQHAHQKAVIHRDLKPSNILVTEVDGKAQPKIIDFGIAKAIGYRLTDRTLLTELGAVVGTPEYMSPEQADSAREDVDTRADVYSLGVVLYQLLTGDLPFPSKELRAKDSEELRRTLRETDPPAPSTRLRTLGAEATEIARNRRTDPSALERQLQGDLDSITLKALERDRRRRYGGAAELAEDLRRHLRHEPVVARPPSAGYRMRKYLRRHRLAVGIATGLAVVLVSYAASTAAQARRVAAERDRANREREMAERASKFVVDMLRSAKPQALGKSLWDDLHRRVAAAHGGTSGSSASAETAVASLDSALTGVNPTQTAVRLIDDEILQRAGKTLETDKGLDPRLAGQLETTLGLVYQSLGVPRETARHFERAVALRTATLGPDHPDTLEALRGLARAYGFLGRNAEGEKLFRQAMEGGRRTLGPEHIDTMDATFGVAVLQENLGHSEEAAALFGDLLALQQRKLGPDDIRTLATSSELASSFMSLGKYEEAARLYRSAADGERRTVGPEDPRTLGTLNNLSVVYIHLGQLDQAEQLLSEIYQVQRRTMGEDRVETLNTLGNLAMIQLEQRHLPEAEKRFTDLVERSQRTLGRENPITLEAVQGLARTSLLEGRSEKAESLTEQSLAGRRRVLGPDHPQTLESVASLAEARNAKHRYADAERLSAEAVAGYERAKMATGDVMAFARATHGRALLGLKRHADAERELLQAEKLWRPGADRAEVVESLVELYDAWEGTEPGHGHTAEAARWKAALSDARK